MTIAKFTKSPLTEVVCGVEFNAPEFSSVHFGLYWQAIREKFPVLPLDRSPIGEVELLPIMPKLRRVWFESVDKKQLIQLQANRFHYNWRRQDENEEYPHFELIFPQFEQEWQTFQNWWIEQEGLPLQPMNYELTYLNQVDSKFGWHDSSDTHKIFTFVGKEWNGFLQNPSSYRSEIHFPLPDSSGSLSVSLKQIKIEENLSAVFFELTCKGEVKSETKAWFKMAHDFTVKAFLELTTEEIQEEWGVQWLQQ